MRWAVAISMLFLSHLEKLTDDLQLSHSWGMGHWRGPWSGGSGLWSRYPSIDAELRPILDALGSLSSNVARSSPDESVKKGWTGTFWMSIEDFANEFSQAWNARRRAMTLGECGLRQVLDIISTSRFQIYPYEAKTKWPRGPSIRFLSSIVVIGN